MTIKKKQYFSALELFMAPTRLNTQTTFYIPVNPHQTDLTFSFNLELSYQTAYILKIPVSCLSVCCSKYLNPRVLSFLNVNCYFCSVSIFWETVLPSWTKVLKSWDHTFLMFQIPLSKCEVSSRDKQITRALVT